MIKNKFFYLAWLMRNERLSHEKLRCLQNRKLRKLVHHAYENTRMYREKWDEAGVRPGDVLCVEDLGKLPVVDKKDFHQFEKEDILDKTIRDQDGLITVNTSGSSGITLEFWIEPAYDQFRKAQFLRPYLTNGNGLFDRVLWFRALPVMGRRWFQRIGFMPEHQVYSGKKLENQLKTLLTVKPNILKGYGSVLSLLALKVMEDKIKPPTIKLIFTDSELLTPQIRRTIEEAFEAPVIDVYGSFETENVAYECDRHEGYHIASDCVVMEFLKDGYPVEPGEEGEIVCTVLDNVTTPFIRYNLHDLGTYREERCSCGRSFPLMTKIIGRTHDYLITEDGQTVSSTTIEGHLWPLARYMYEFQVMQAEANLFKVFVVPTKLFNKAAEHAIKAAFSENFPAATVLVKTVGKIKRDKSGKLKTFKSIFTMKPDK